LFHFKLRIVYFKTNRLCAEQKITSGLSQLKNKVSSLRQLVIVSCGIVKLYCCITNGFIFIIMLPYI
jgi:hypothetical protein